MGCTIMAPGLDPQWSTNAPEGEALLAAPARAEEVAVVAQPNTDHVPMTTVEPRKRIPLVPSTAADDEAVVGPGDSFA